ncbi:hypothetical protein WDZ11_00015 (plasmid) [Roseomonas mucosa]|uniref:hypothetical protein n=1 Tax=Roseomonas mucosa TaxID=207340 RepID=UPI0030CCA8A0
MDRLAANLIAADLGDAAVVIDTLSLSQPDLATRRGLEDALARVRSATAALRRAEVALRAEAALRG